MQHGPMLIVTLETQAAIAMVPGPGLLGLHELRGDAGPPNIRQHAAEPTEVRRRHQLIADREPYRLAVHPCHQNQHIVPPAKPPSKKALFLARPEHLVV